MADIKKNAKAGNMVSVASKSWEAGGIQSYNQEVTESYCREAGIPSRGHPSRIRLASYRPLSSQIYLASTDHR